MNDYELWFVLLGLMVSGVIYLLFKANPEADKYEKLHYITGGIFVFSFIYLICAYMFAGVDMLFAILTTLAFGGEIKPEIIVPWFTNYPYNWMCFGFSLSFHIISCWFETKSISIDKHNSRKGST